MKKQLLLMILALLPMLASADAVEINGIYYNLIAKGGNYYAEVTSNPNKYTGSVEIPASVTYENVEYSVTSIGWWAFQDCSGLTSVTIPNSVTSIEYGAFQNCSGLTSVTIGNSVKSIGNYAFSGCTSLTSVNITDVAAWCKISFGDNPLSYAHHLYLNGEEIIDLVIPNGVTSIGNHAFYCCSSLTSVTIPNSVTSIGESAFIGCSGLQAVHISDLETWCKIAFSDYYSNPLYCAHHLYLNNQEIKKLVIPNSVTSIGSYAFRGCSGLTSVTIPNSVTSIGEYVFSGCSGLTSVTIPNSVTTIGRDAFYDCSGLTSVTIPNSVTSIGEYNQEIKGETNVEIIPIIA